MTSRVGVEGELYVVVDGGQADRCLKVSLFRNTALVIFGRSRS